MYFQAGSFVHPDNLTNVSHTIRPGRNARGFVDRVTHTLAVRGTIIPDATQAAIRTQIDLLLDKYNTGRSIGDSGLFHDDGTASSHFLRESGSLGGVLVEAIDFPFDESDGQYATARDFSLALRATYPNSGLAFQDFREEIQVVGTGGPRFKLVETLTGRPQKQIVARRTMIAARQTGNAVGLRTYPLYPRPLWPQHENIDRRQQNKGSPQNNAGVFTDWPISWSYSFQSPVPLFGTPNRK